MSKLQTVLNEIIRNLTVKQELKDELHEAVEALEEKSERERESEPDDTETHSSRTPGSAVPGTPTTARTEDAPDTGSSRTTGAAAPGTSKTGRKDG